MTFTPPEETEPEPMNECSGEFTVYARLTVEQVLIL